MTGTPVSLRVSFATKLRSGKQTVASASSRAGPVRARCNVKVGLPPHAGAQPVFLRTPGPKRPNVQTFNPGIDTTVTPTPAVFKAPDDWYRDEQSDAPS